MMRHLFSSMFIWFARRRCVRRCVHQFSVGAGHLRHVSLSVTLEVGVDSMMSIFLSSTKVPLVQGRHYPLRKLPSLVLFCLVGLSFLSPDVPEIWLAILQLYITWMYFRFFATYPSGRQGDRNFKLASIFPKQLKAGAIFSKTKNCFKLSSP